MKFEQDNKVLEAKIIKEKESPNAPKVILAKLDCWDTKLFILKNKKEALKDSNIYIESDLTRHEKFVNWKLREFSKQQKVF